MQRPSWSRVTKFSYISEDATRDLVKKHFMTLGRHSILFRPLQPPTYHTTEQFRPQQPPTPLSPPAEYCVRATTQHPLYRPTPPLLMLTNAPHYTPPTASEQQDLLALYQQFHPPQLRLYNPFTRRLADPYYPRYSPPHSQPSTSITTT